ncbi:hypothetical protein C8R45DRAFT_1209085 [Mycena sanguinolenta]|nr:hypothetical protein C8R45DRAFT_1209085 [Mycena sanguinolenta]
MNTIIAFLALLSLASVVVPYVIPGSRGISSCNAQDRVLVDTHTVTAAGYEFQVSTKACSANALVSRGIYMRQVEDACGISESPNTIPECVIAAFEEPTDPVNNLFEVAPQFAQEFSLGTCLWAWINEQPVGGTTLEYCYQGLSALGTNIDGRCLSVSWNESLGGFITPILGGSPNPILDWVFECILYYYNLGP